LQGHTDSSGLGDILLVRFDDFLGVVCPALNLGFNGLFVRAGNHLVESLLFYCHDIGAQALLDLIRRPCRRRASGRRKEDEPSLLHHGNHPEQTKCSFELIVVAAGQKGNAMSATVPARGIHPIVAAGRQREKDHGMRTVKNRLDDPCQGEVSHVDRKDRCFRARLLQQGRRLLGTVRGPDYQLDVSQLLFRFCQAGFHRLYLPGIGSPVAVLRCGRAAEDDADS